MTFDLLVLAADNFEPANVLVAYEELLGSADCSVVNGGAGPAEAAGNDSNWHGAVVGLAPEVWPGDDGVAIAMMFDGIWPCALLCSAELLIVFLDMFWIIELGLVFDDALVYMGAYADDWWEDSAGAFD